MAHELRNALSPAHMAFKVLQMGQVGLHSQTATILERALLRMSELVSQMLLDVRRQSGSAIERSRVMLSSLVDELVLALPLEREVRVVNQVDASLECVANRTALVSSIGNILQNAIKYTRQGGVVTIRGHRSADDVHIDVEDECGGLPARVEELMRPFVQRSQDRSGLGLGLSIARRAAMVNGGTLLARNIPGKGCGFTVTLSSRKDVPS